MKDNKKLKKQYELLQPRQKLILRELNDITKWKSRDLKLVTKWCRLIIYQRKIKKIRRFFKRNKKNKNK